MEDILNWVSTYSPPIILLIALGASLIYIIKQVTEKAINHQFDKYKKEVELKLERRSSFEERVLIDRYTLIKEIQTKLGSIATNLNRIKSGQKIDGFIVNSDIVPLTEVLETLTVNKYVITVKFHQLFWEQSQLLIKLANAKDSNNMAMLTSEYQKLMDRFYHEMNEMFNIDKIKCE
ncbi:hypothetical protein [Pleomorphovibrio marinus]|uniref:hypothetical protein n=1 Tax=Pleomorphovibrio marinus TaxID=2164132 RepID=UPI000E0B62B2|nr:hypothetical protein [Pleomorphovibrio marinus]